MADIPHADGWELPMLGLVFSIDVRALDELSRDHRSLKPELFGNHLLAVLRPARYLDARESVQIRDLRVLVGPTFLVMVGRDWIRDPADVRARLDQTLQLDDLGAISLPYTADAKLVEEGAPSWPVWRTTSTRSRASRSVAR